jgi:hypothetical protein
MMNSAALHEASAKDGNHSPGFSELTSYALTPMPRADISSLI